MDEFLVKYLLEEATESEQRQVDSWISSNEENRKYFEQFKTIWVQSRNIEHESNVDVHEAWKRFESGLLNKTVATFSTKSKVIPLLWKFAVAARIAVTIGIAGYFFFNSGVKISSGDEVVVKTLPDNSIITLNKKSTLSYNKSFNEKLRQVSLSGEAFFKISPNKQKPFIIKAGDVSVTVVGTSFNVRESEAGVGVIVETGTVSVQAGDKKVKLLPHQKIFIPKGSDDLLVKANNDKLYNYYRTHKFICTNTPLKELVVVLNKSFDARIEIANPEIANLKLTTQFQKENLKEILSIISATLDVAVEYQKDGKILIK
jgi:ferric-dicitrate binding protein FerR (iron transport regulator)